MKAVTKAMPSIVTLCSIFCGLLSAIYAIEGNLVASAWFIIAAGILDSLDGKVSRMLNAQSKFGVEFDSIADVCSFGFAPAILFYQYMTQPDPHAPAISVPFDTLAFALCFVFLACGALRLARFNTQLVGFNKSTFTGVPIPSAAGFVASFIAFMNTPLMAGVSIEWLFPALVLLAAGLMVSTFKYDTMPRLSWSTPGNRLKLVILLSWMAVAAFYPAEAFFPFGAFYIASGLVRALMHIVRREPDVALDESALETSDGEEALA